MRKHLLLDFRIWKKIFSVAAITTGLFSCQTNVDETVKYLTPGVSQALANFRKQHLKDVQYQLFFDIPAEKQEALKGIAAISCNAMDPQAFLLDFKADIQQIDSVCLNGIKVDYQLLDEHLRVLPELKSGKNTITVYFTCSDQSLNRRDHFLYTLLVPDRARTVFPCFDQPDIKALYKLSLEIPSQWKAVANGKAISEVNAGNGRTLVSFQQTEPLSTYLFSFVAGELKKETFQREGRAISIYHRENDAEKVAQCSGMADEVFDALEWMEAYTGIPYPFDKYDLIIIPGFQFGGMEHTGATLYTDGRMFLNKQSTLRERLNRSALIAHETTHMWFGDYVTMKWFDDVWTKEVFANYFASQMLKERFPKVNHRLNFMADYIPGAYAEDCTEGTNSIKQDLDNLQNAGLVYGNIIYKKSPIVMEMLVEKMGQQTFRAGLQQYLKTYAYGNATWDDLIDILDDFIPDDLKAWSHCWVNEKGHPTIETHLESNHLVVNQFDKWKRGVCWPQKLSFLVIENGKEQVVTANFSEDQTTIRIPLVLPLVHPETAVVLPNNDSRGYGLFLLEDSQQEIQWQAIKQHASNDTNSEVLRGSLLINLYENLRAGNLSAETFRNELIDYLSTEENPLLYTIALGYLGDCQQWYLTDSELVEKALWQLVLTHKQPSFRLQAFRLYRTLAHTPEAIQQLYTIWKECKMPGNCHLSESDYMKLAYQLAIHLPEQADAIIEEQAGRISQADRQKEFAFISAAVSPSEVKRDSVFAALMKKENRSVEPWASSALSLLNHPVRSAEAIRYIRPALEKMQEVQQTGDIFFPRAWARALLSGHTSHEAAEEVRKFFADYPDYPLMLGNKIKQQASHLEGK